MDNLEEGGTHMDNLGKKRGSGKIFMADVETRKQQREVVLSACNPATALDGLDCHKRWTFFRKDFVDF